MAKVHDIPRYKNQMKYKVKSFLQCAKDMYSEDISRSKDMLGTKDLTFGISETDCILVAINKIKIPLLNDEDLITDFRDALECIRQAYEHGFTMQDTMSAHRIASFGVALNRALTESVSASHTTLTDDSAMFKLVAMYLGNEVESTSALTIDKRWEEASMLARDIAAVGAEACRFGQNVRDVLLNRGKMPDSMHGLAAKTFTGYRQFR